MPETQSCTNTRYMVERKQRFENDSDVSVLSSDNESTPSETTLDDICESLEGPLQDLSDILGGEPPSSQIVGRYLPIRFSNIGGIQHNSSSIGFGYTMGKFPGVISSIVSRNTIPFDVEMIAERFHTMPLRGDGFHIGTLHCTEAR